MSCATRCGPVTAEYGVIDDIQPIETVRQLDRRNALSNPDDSLDTGDAIRVRVKKKRSMIVFQVRVADLLEKLKQSSIWPALDVIIIIRTVESKRGSE